LDTQQLRHTSAARRTRRGRTKRRRSRWAIVAGAVGIGVLLTVVIVVLLARHVVSAGKSDLATLSDQQPVSEAQTTQIYAGDGTLLAYLYGEQNRTIISSQDIAPDLKHAIVAIEDQRFYEHNGVDLQGLMRALAVDVSSGGAAQGASTITEQLVGNLYLNRQDTSISRKIREAWLAMQYEKKYSKDEILSQYLNTVFFGANAYGVQAAAQTYFGKDPADLTLAESALLAGLPQAPTGYNPRNNPDRALARRNEVLKAMLAQNYITQSQYDQAVATPIQLAPSSPYTAVREPYVVDYVKQQLVAMFGQDAVFKGGLRVQTTIDPAFQALATKSISAVLNQSGDPSAALVSIQPSTGYIMAMVSSSDYDTSKFNLAAQAQRQPGSTFKVFALVGAIEMGIDPYSTYYQSKPLQLQIPGSTQPWSVSTFGNRYYGTSSIYQATLRSDNSVYAQLTMDIGANRVVDVAERMGITATLDPYPAIVLGGLKYGVSPLEMASAYGTLADAGRHVEPTIISKVWDASGKLIYDANPKATQAISSGVAYAATQILQQNIAKGTGTAANIDRPAAGKTGTASDYADAWFCGYTPNLSTAVWVGHPEGNIPMTDVHGISVTGGSFPAEIWQKFMYDADRTYPQQEFAVPKVLVQYGAGFNGSYTVTPTSSTTTSSTSTTSTTSTTLPGGDTTTTSGTGTTQPPTSSTTTTTTSGTTTTGTGTSTTTQTSAQGTGVSWY
jgi:penicillin-binding protein 1A